MPLSVRDSSSSSVSRMMTARDKPKSPNGLWYPGRARSNVTPTRVLQPAPQAAWYDRHKTVLVVSILSLALLVTFNWGSLLEWAAFAIDSLKGFLTWAEAMAKRAGEVHVLGITIPIGPLFIILGYVVACVFMLPIFGFHSVSGYLYGTLRGSLLVTMSQTLGACCCFYLSRYLFRGYLSRYLQNKWGKKYNAIDDALAEDSFKIVLMMRLSPVIPFGLTNYVAGCGKVPIGRFAAGTWLGLCPGTTFYVFLGHLMRLIEEGEMTQEEKDSQSGWKFYIVGFGLLATAKLLHLASQKATRVLADAGFKDD